jgi:hypothetical protein
MKFLNKKKRSILSFCLLFSLGAHVCFLFFLSRNPFLLQNRFVSLFRKSPSPFEVVKAEEDELNRQEELEELFDELISYKPRELAFDLPPSALNEPSQEMLSSLPLPSLQPELEGDASVDLPSALSLPSFSPLLASTETAYATGEQGDALFSQLKFEKSASCDHRKELTSSAFAIDIVEDTDDLGLDSLPAKAVSESDLPSVAVLESFVKEPSFDEEISKKSLLEPVLLASDEKEKLPSLLLPKTSLLLKETDRTLAFSSADSLPDVDDYLLPEVAQAVSWDEAFDAKVELMPKSDGKGFVFAVSLTPTEEIHLESMPQNYYFLIDRSSSIERHRFAAFKRGVLKAISCLQAGDKFNIVVFDKTVKKLSEQPILFSKAALQRAEEFLEPQEHGNMFSGADIFSSLQKVIPHGVSQEEAHTAILITDGDTSQSSAKQQKQISQWIEKNASHVTLFTAAIGKGNNLIMLDLLSSLSGGQLLYSDTHAAFPRRLGKLLLNLRNPLVKEIMLSAIPKDSEAEILFYPSSNHLPNMLAKQSYEIMGTIDQLSDFTLVIQGRHKDRWVSITKEISLTRAVKTSRLLEKKWANASAKSQYESFLKEGKVSHLIKAKELLKTAGSEIAMQ